MLPLLSSLALTGTRMQAGGRAVRRNKAGELCTLQPHPSSPAEDCSAGRG